MRKANRQKPRKLKVVAIGPKRQKKQSLCNELVVRMLDEPRQFDPGAQVEWLFRCFGFDDDDRLAKEIFKELVRSSERGIRSADISSKCNVTQGAVVYHLNAFMRSGLVTKHGRFYHLRKPSLDATLSDLEEEVVRHFEKMRRLAMMLNEMF